MQSLTELTIILVLLVANGVLAMSEIALVSARKARLRQWADEGNASAAKALELAAEPNEFLSTIQVGITLIGIFAGAFAGATISDEIAAQLRRIPVLEPYAKAVSMALVVSLITYLSLVVGELVPKRFALTAPEKIACLVAGPISILSRVCRPLVLLLSATSNFIFRVFNVRESTEPSVTEAEIHIMVEEAAELGVFEEREQELIASVMRLSERSAVSIMTPRTHIEWLDVKADSATILATARSLSSKTLLVGNGSLDDLLGVVDRDAVFERLLDRDTVDLRAMVRTPIVVPENISALELLAKFRETKEHLAAIMDEYGGLIGIATADDVFEAIVGELPLQGEIPKWEMVQREDGSWLLDGQTPIEDFVEMFELNELPGHSDEHYNTVAGFILSQLERVPDTGEAFEYERLRFEIVDMDHYRIDKVLISKVA